jgi:hypothetical protein
VDFQNLSTHPAPSPYAETFLNIPIYLEISKSALTCNIAISLSQPAKAPSHLVYLGLESHENKGPKLGIGDRALEIPLTLGTANVLKGDDIKDHSASVERSPRLYHTPWMKLLFDKISGTFSKTISILSTPCHPPK